MYQYYFAHSAYDNLYENLNFTPYCLRALGNMFPLENLKQNFHYFYYLLFIIFSYTVF